VPPLLVPGGGAHSLAREGVGESQFRRGDIHCGTLIYMYFVGRLKEGQRLSRRSTFYVVFFVLPNWGWLVWLCRLKINGCGLE
jgi:hypothetical protein